MNKKELHVLKNEISDVSFMLQTLKNEFNSNLELSKLIGIKNYEITNLIKNAKHFSSDRFIDNYDKVLKAYNVLKPKDIENKPITQDFTSNSIALEAKVGSFLIEIHDFLGIKEFKHFNLRKLSDKYHIGSNICQVVRKHALDRKVQGIYKWKSNVTLNKEFVDFILNEYRKFDPAYAPTYKKNMTGVIPGTVQINPLQSNYSDKKYGLIRTFIFYILKIFKTFIKWIF